MPAGAWADGQALALRDPSALLVARLVGEEVDLAAVGRAGSAGVGVDGEEEVGLVVVGDGGAVVERHFLVALAGQEDLETEGVGEGGPQAARESQGRLPSPGGRPDPGPRGRRPRGRDRSRRCGWPTARSRVPWPRARGPCPPPPPPRERPGSRGRGAAAGPARTPSSAGSACRGVIANRLSRPPRNWIWSTTPPESRSCCRVASTRSRGTATVTRPSSCCTRNGTFSLASKTTRATSPVRKALTAIRGMLAFPSKSTRPDGRQSTLIPSRGESIGAASPPAPATCPGPGPPAPRAVAGRRRPKPGSCPCRG